MVRGFTFFKCPKCGKVFKGLDIEYNATVFTQPLPCPDCGTESPNVGLSGWMWDKFKKKICGQKKY